MVLIEAAVESLDGALAAADGGANRIELCTDLARGGTTPDEPLLRDCRARLSIPIFALVRPRPGNFVYTAAEHRTMLDRFGKRRRRCARHRHRRATASGRIAERDGGNSAARPLPVTFHRAFDECVEQAVALERLILLGIDRVLTSGGAATAPEGAAQIRSLIAQAKHRIEVMPGGGINAENVADLVQVTGAREIHFSVRDAEKVRRVNSSIARWRP